MSDDAGVYASANAFSGAHDNIDESAYASTSTSGIPSATTPILAPTPTIATTPASLFASTPASTPGSICIAAPAPTLTTALVPTSTPTPTKASAQASSLTLWSALTPIPTPAGGTVPTSMHTPAPPTPITITTTSTPASTPASTSISAYIPTSVRTFTALATATSAPAMTTALVPMTAASVPTPAPMFMTVATPTSTVSAEVQVFNVVVHIRSWWWREPYATTPACLVLYYRVRFYYALGGRIRKSILYGISGTCALVAHYVQGWVLRAADKCVRKWCGQYSIPRENTNLFSVKHVCVNMAVGMPYYGWFMHNRRIIVLHGAATIGTGGYN
ncbi:unnamed protein product [Prorocentrum cordatum]|uniref:Uncharacterized protein n=1 Tax=Prorocentrum cordatum TaxID=2364126 RepID=A0ABN9SPW6_9DINO|nr:unnamed protein product [Polarella glacialis]